MKKEIVHHYIINKMCWRNKDTTPIVKIIDIKHTNDIDTLKIIYDVLFKTKSSDVERNYMKNIECIIWKEDILKFTRENSLNLLLNDI